MKEFWFSLIYFLELYRGGFRIHKTPPETECSFYRFYWHKDPIKDFPDIDKAGPYWNTMRAGHVEQLGADKTKDLTLYEVAQYMREITKRVFRN